MRGFTDSERRRIRRGLLDAGRDLFTRYGLKKTTIAELTDPVGIAPSTFYQFFDSKEALYAAVLEDTADELVGPVMAQSFEATDDPEEAIRTFLRLLIDEIETNPLLKQVITDGPEAYQRGLSEAERRAEREEELAFLVPYVEQWHEEGELRGDDPNVVANVVRAVVLVTLHRDDLGEELYPATRDLLIDSVAAGLTDI